jgi:lactoylglutathione lyase
MRRAIACLVLCGFTGNAQEAHRPPILAAAHMAIYVSDLAKARAFYEDFLGYAEPYSLKAANGNATRIAFVKINEDQYIELFAEHPRAEGLQLNHVAFQTSDAEGMRQYLASRGIKVPDQVGKGQIGNSNFNVTDPDGHIVEIVQYEPDGWTRRARGRFLPDTRISTRMMHFGVTIDRLDPAMAFYHDVLGFEDIWRGPPSGKTLSWVNVRVTDGPDYLELMLYSTPPTTQSELGTKNHICLMVPDIQKAVATLESRRSKTGYSRPIEIKVGQNGKRQANLYDADLTRVELMEPTTADGKPVPSSTAPPPRR